MTDLVEILNEWQTNLKFREDFKKNPEHALEEAGFHLSHEDFNKIQTLLNLENKDSDNEELSDRINK